MTNMANTCFSYPISMMLPDDLGRGQFYMHSLVAGEGLIAQHN